MPINPSEDLFERSFRFTCDVYDYCEDLVWLRGLPCRVVYQLFDAAGSVGANRAEAKCSYSVREFAAKECDLFEGVQGSEVLAAGGRREAARKRGPSQESASGVERACFNLRRSGAQAEIEVIRPSYFVLRTSYFYF